MDQVNDVIHQTVSKDDSASPIGEENQNNLFGELEPASSEGKQEKPKDLERADGEDEGYEKFSLAENKLDKSFCGNFGAVFLKRFQSYKRSKKRVFTEIFLPSAFLILGTWISSIDFSYRSDSRMLGPEMYPLKQKLLVNQDVYDVVNSDLTPQDIMKNMPDFDSAFEVTYNKNKPGKTFDDFGDDLYQFGKDEAYKEPYMYGSYEIY